MKWTKFSPEVNEFPSHSLRFSPLCFTGFHGRAVSAKGSISPGATVGKVAASLSDQGSHMMELLARPESKELQSWLSSATEF